jgi:hypothetical protein
LARRQPWSVPVQPKMIVVADNLFHAIVAIVA